MARYKHTDAGNGQGLFLSVNLKEQLLPGTFEHMLDELIGKRIDTSGFDKNYKNDEAGAKAMPPEALAKLVIYGCTKGVKSPRGIAELSRNNIVAKALAADGVLRGTGLDRRENAGDRRMPPAFKRVD